tara:strand:- start:87 stop:662 length:576 start_codon:yes stop_codon:yes gene_type:complete
MEALNKQNFEDLIKGKKSFLSSLDALPKAIFSGSFNPLHQGHKAMHDHARKVLDTDIFFEVCIQNADKPTLNYEQVTNVINQFSGSDNWLLTKVGKFTEKAMLFPNSTFLLGVDTLARVVNEKFYLNKDQMLKELEIFNSNNNNFLVFGREVEGSFISLQDLNIPDHINSRFTEVNEKDFRLDISSTELRS